MYGIKINTDANFPSASSPVYQIGDTISLILQVDFDDIILIGDTITVEIKDYFGNIIALVPATRINDIYAAEWSIPLSVHKSYNVSGNAVTGLNPGYYYLYDNWIFPDASFLRFEFLVQQAPEDPIAENCEYIVNILNVESSDGTQSDDLSFRFTSTLTPYYSSVEDIKSVHSDILNDLDDFDVVRKIYEISRYIDVQMAPEVIYRQEQFDLARRMYTKYESARVYLNSWLNTSKETKKLDMFEYSRDSGDPDRLLRKLEELIDKYANVIWAGGKDTPFTTKVFTKGLFDPNRPNMNRLGLDTSDIYPWVNTTTQNYVTQIDGRDVEIRGTRTVSFLKNRSSFPNVYLRSEGVS